MDRKTIIVFAVCVAAFMGYTILYNKLYPQKPVLPPRSTATAPGSKQTRATTPQPSAAVTAPAIVQPAAPRPPEKLYTLKTALQEVELTTYGGAIKKVILLSRPDGIIREPLEFTSPSAPPLMAMAGFDGEGYDAVYDIVEDESDAQKV